ncbi:MAG: hypothetical protein GY932_02585 [Arcobacter sp.]|nr:hypothetical protein [Arcobacter sp.]
MILSYKKLLGLIFLSTFSYAQVQTEGFIALDSQNYSSKKDKHSNNITLEQKLKLSYEKDDFSSVLELYMQEDSTDFSNKHDNKRSFIRLNEFYTQYETNNYKVLIGKNIKFWGALEVKNIVDTFNIQDGRTDPFKIDKIGAYNISYSHYFEDSEFSIITKIYEQKNKIASSNYIYSILNENESFNNKLKSKKSLYRPSIYLTYNGSTYGDQYSLDYALIYENGYDSQRYLSRLANEYIQHAYLVNKFMTFNTLVYNSTLYKLEALYTNIIEDKNISDYIHLAIGVEHTLESLENGNEIGLLAEYYYYDTLEDNKLNDISLGENFQNDLFLGLRYSFNDIEDSNAVGGVILDTKYNEQSYYLNYETRILDILKLKLDYRYNEPSSTHNTVYSRQGRHQRFAFNISYHF